MKMIKSAYWLLFLVGLTAALSATAQNDTAVRPGLRVSLLTCGPGAEIYSVFGHTAVRIIDSATNTDIVYNYGTFNGYDEQFELNFMRGKLLYYLSEEDFAGFKEDYMMEGRWVDEQVLEISASDKRAIQDYLTTNLLPENRAYKYDFFFDNCATRIRDIFTETHGSAFRFGNVVPEKGITFRQIINRYLNPDPWERLGINMLLGSKIDKVMTNEQMMFLPDYLKDAVAGATLSGKKYAAAPDRIVRISALNAGHPDYSVTIVLWSLFVLLAAGLLVPKLRFVGNLLSSVLLILTGLLGVLMLLMWFGTDHKACSDNFNLLWALPTNLLYVFRKRQTKYALIAILCIFLSVIFHLVGLQGLLLPDMVPLLLMLLMIFGVHFRKYSVA
ncbi:DUF4105 domain-containing protein [Rurimicrobium arvi]|uniref:DUF4105 domain-containing protein n=1 Tax=Rurimicrobium arvi TaxID=2049916 RepID=A0ABP8MP07_9BACT